eukprot:CAMPEP_0167743238 /NCGR_PEP_ID=MMETSP0110_2-20121227/1901_1 /TAXON_ID=629695 /ORGANISM="Gymnochlora sp., Strain CCMP2014" /LENGTH=128 /DNA_ID=CAMNT_0007627579 /DNA_START=314 /DNA_END=700 /DNA_ORIENTATION=+
MFTPVGGKLDPNETPYAAAIRETREETGIEVEEMKFCGILTESLVYNWTLYVYLAEIDDMEPPKCDEGTLEWVGYDDILNIPTPPTDWFVYKYALESKPFALSAEVDENFSLVSMVEEFEGISLTLPE